MEENKKLTEGKQENVYTITFDILNGKQVFLMPYVGQKVGALFNKNFDVIPKDFAHDQHDFDWSVYYNIYSHGDTINFTRGSGLILPSHNYEGEGLEVLCEMEFVVYALMKNPTDKNFMSAFGDAVCASFPIILKEKDITIWEDDFGVFAARYSK